MSIRRGNDAERHGLSKTPEYRAWVNMIVRCRERADYAGRVRVHESFATSFQTFYDHIGPRPPKGTLDRIDTNGDYEPGNVRWITIQQQQRNRRDNRWLTANGRTMLLEDWAAELGMGHQALAYRLDVAKWPVERALTEPKWSTRKKGLRAASVRLGRNYMDRYHGD